MLAQTHATNMALGVRYIQSQVALCTSSCLGTQHADNMYGYDIIARPESMHEYYTGASKHSCGCTYTSLYYSTDYSFSGGRRRAKHATKKLCLKLLRRVRLQPICQCTIEQLSAALCLSSQDALELCRAALSWQGLCLVALS